MAFTVIEAGWLLIGVILGGMAAEFGLLERWSKHHAKD